LTDIVIVVFSGRSRFGAGSFRGKKNSTFSS